MTGLRRAVGPRGLDPVWITHQHSDHVGGAKAVLGSFPVAVYAANGRDLERTAVLRDVRAGVASSGGSSASSTRTTPRPRARPKYAVISAAKPGEGTNDRYCHPRSVVVENLTKAMGGVGERTVRAFDGAVKCKQGDPQPEHWLDVPASDRLWVTARDGDVTLATSGDGTFTRE